MILTVCTCVCIRPAPSSAMHGSTGHKGHALDAVLLVYVVCVCVRPSVYVCPCPCPCVHMCVSVCAACLHQALQCTVKVLRCAFVRSPPASGSAMHWRLVAMARAAAAYGKFQAAREAFAAAGQWVELMPLCALQGDFDSLRDYAARVSGTQVCSAVGAVHIIVKARSWLLCCCLICRIGRLKCIASLLFPW